MLSTACYLRAAVIGTSRTTSSQAYLGHSWRRLYTSPANDELSEGERLIAQKLQDRFNASKVQVQDVSGGCGSFYAITIASKAFVGLSTLKQHKLVNETLKQEISGIHGLQLKTIADEA